MEDYGIIDLYWDRQQIKDSKGKTSWLLRGKDYDLEWIKMGDSFAKFEKRIFKYDNLCFEKLKKVLDFDTFELIVSTEYGIAYFKDKTNVYFKCYNQESIIDGADPNKFKILDLEKGISTDQSQYFYYEKIIPFDISKATILNNYYTIADGKVYFCFQEIEGANADTFMIIRENLGKDNNNIYLRNQVVLGADSETFNILEGCTNDKYYEDMNHTFYAKDKAMAYFINATAKAIKPIKSKSLSEFRFEIIDERGFCFDNEYRYYFGKRKKL